MFQNLLLRSIVLTVCCLGLAASSHAQDQTFAMKLNNTHFEGLKKYGSLKSHIPEKARGKIGVVELKFDQTADKEPVELDIVASVQDGVAIFVVDDDLIAKIKGQPVKIKLADNAKKVQEVSLIYSVEAPVPDSPSIKDADGNVMDVFFVRLGANKVFAGGIDGLQAIKLDTRFGSISIPLDQIAGIRFHINDREEAVVTLTNGDTITGTPALSSLDLRTDWGDATIDGKAIESITSTKSSHFQKRVTDFGPRWVLEGAQAIAPPARQ